MSTLIETIATHQRDTLVGGHVARTGTRAMSRPNLRSWTI